MQASLETTTPKLVAHQPSTTPNGSDASKISTLLPISAGCIVSAAAMYPADVVRALRMASASEATATSTVQLLRSFISAHGVLGLAKQGVFPEIARATLMRVAQFFSYPLAHEALFGGPPSSGSTSTQVLSGMAACLPSSLAITPLENAKIALQLDHAKQFNNSTDAALRHLWRRGALAPYIGFQGVFTRSALSFGPYIAALPYCQRVTRPAAAEVFGGSSAFGTVLGNLTGGLLAGALGAAINCPFDLVRTNLQKQAVALAAEPMSRSQIATLAFSPSTYFEVGRQIAYKNGVGALYRGLAFKIAHIGGVGALNAALIPYFKRTFGVRREVF
uniref:Mitochondrial carrier protein n=1 Tax=Coccolithus braarudii TaxID=221442 RepID=A0A6T7DMD3_9EUKA